MLLLLLTITSFAMFTQVAEAKRFGGGKSFGFYKKMPSKSFSKKSPAKTAPGAATAAGAGAKSGASKWLGPLAGLAAGGLLAAMIFGDGFDGIQMFDILLFGIVAFILFKLFTRRKQQYNQQNQYAGYQDNEDDYEQEQAPKNYQTKEMPSPQTTDYSHSGSIIGSAVSENAQPISALPAWFDEVGFVENAKSHFVSVQSAWDAADLTELESYCSPALFKALSAEMKGLQAGDNHTEVEEVNVEMLDAVTDEGYLVVSVRFTGYITEDKGEDAHAFNEIWHIRRLEAGEGDWQIAGIQQS